MRADLPSFEVRGRAIEIVFFVLSLLGELLLQIVAELFAELGVHSVGHAFRRRERTHPLLAGLGIAILGSLAGVLTSVVWPMRVFPHGPLPGVGLLVSPLLSGQVMEQFGRWRERRGQPRSFIATYWGGALFAFAMAFLRFVMVGKP